MSRRSQGLIHGAESSQAAQRVSAERKGPLALTSLIHINRSRRLLELVRHAERLGRIERAVSAYLAPEIKRHCEVGNVRRATLVMNVSSPVWAVRLRFIVPDLLRYLQSSCTEEGLQAVRVRVSPSLASSATTKPRARLTRSIDGDGTSTGKAVAALTVACIEPPKWRVTDV